MLLEKLKTFVTIVEKGSYKIAAQKIHLSQPAITHHIKSLESYFNVTLFRPSPRKPTLTIEGNQLYLHAKKVLSDMTSLEEEMDKFRYTKDRITFSATFTISTYILPRLLGRFRQNNPGVYLNFKVGNSEFVRTQLIEGRLNFGILGKMGNLPRRFRKIHFHREPFIFICSTSNPLTQKNMINCADLDHYSLLNREEGTKTRSILEKWLKKHGLNMGRHNEFGQIETIKHAVEQDLGIAILPAISVQNELETGRLARFNVSDFDLAIDYDLVAQPEKYLSPASISLLSELSPDLPK